MNTDWSMLLEDDVLLQGKPLIPRCAIAGPLKYYVPEDLRSEIKRHNPFFCGNYGSCGGSLFRRNVAIKCLGECQSIVSLIDKFPSLLHSDILLTCLFEIHGYSFGLSPSHCETWEDGWRESGKAVVHQFKKLYKKESIKRIVAFSRTIHTDEQNGHGGLGDTIAALSAVREYARRHPDEEVYFEGLDPVVRAFGDGLVKVGPPMHTQSTPLINVKNNVSDLNTVGCFMVHLGMQPDKPPDPELPEVPCLSSLTPQRYVAIQPWAYSVPNPPTEVVQKKVDECKEKLGVPVIAVGKPTKTKQVLTGVDYSYLDYDIIKMLSIIRHSRIILTPMSASCFIASAYHVPCIFWGPNNGDDWLVNFRGMNRITEI